MHSKEHGTPEYKRHSPPPETISHTRKIVYLANPYGFSNLTNEHILNKLISELEKYHVEVFEPFRDMRPRPPHVWTPDAAFNVSYILRDKIFESDAVFAIINGVPPDEGVSVEIGIATALKKPIFLFRDDYRLASDTNGSLPVNAMLYSGIPQVGNYGDWCDYLYGCFEQISNGDKAFRRWAEQRPLTKDDREPCATRNNMGTIGSFANGNLKYNVCNVIA